MSAAGTEDGARSKNIINLNDLWRPVMLRPRATIIQRLTVAFSRRSSASS